MQLNSERPIVYITGAGPGDPALLTIKAKEIFKKAEVIVYDALVSDEILDLIKSINSRLKLIYVGKKAYVDDKSISQAKIHNLLLELSKEHKVICRLKGGDPSVFGRVGEEAEFLVKHDILFEIVPGVSSVVSAPAYAGIPLTHRDCTSSFTVLTAHENPNNPSSSIQWNSFDAVNNTLVLLMGTKNFPTIVEKLLALGRKKETPIAIIYKGTTPEQKTWLSTLEKVQSDITGEHITHPSLIVIGEVVNYKKILDWYEKSNLLGKRILLTRSRDQSMPFAGSLLEHGAKPILCPLVDYEVNDLEVYNKDIINNIGTYDWLFFTSQNSVNYFFEILKKNFYDSRALSKVKVAAVGFKTKQALEKYNIHADFVPKKFQLSSLVEELSETENIHDEKILYPTQLGVERDINIVGLHEWPIYRANFIKKLDDNDVEKIKQGIDVVTFFSSNTAQCFFNLIQLHGLEEQIKSAKVAVVGSETAKTCKSLFDRVDIIAESYTEDGLFSSIEAYFKEKSVAVSI